MRYGEEGARGAQRPSGTPPSLPDMSDHYNRLGVKPEASADEIRRAFRREAKRCHPDLHATRPPGEREAMQRQFIQIAQAYQVLGDPEQRLAYDRRLAAERAAAGAARPHPRPASASRPPPRPAASQGPQPPRPASTKPSASTLRGTTPTAPPDLEEMREILREAEQSLAKFGLNLRQPVDVAMEELLDWARALYRDLVGAARGTTLTATPPPRPAKPSGRPQEFPRPAGPARAERAADSLNELAVERELEQIKRGVSRGGTKRPPTLDEELAALKRQHGKPPRE
jgi:curved DNA-binding protein CbpA